MMGRRPGCRVAAGTARQPVNPADVLKHRREDYGALLGHNGLRNGPFMRRDNPGQLPARLFEDDDKMPFLVSRLRIAVSLRDLSQ